ncbi:MAG: histidine kinase [Casimicrobiaceae bacterium]
MVVFVLLLLLFEGTRAWSIHDTPEGFLIGLVTATRVTLLLAVGTFGPLIVEAIGVPTRLRMVLTVLATCLLVGGAALLVLAFADGPITTGVREGRLLSNEAFLLRTCWIYVAAGLLFAAYCQTRDRELEITRAAQAAELARADAQRDIVASRLQVLQARVEPELLFDALGDVKLAYLRDPAAAGALLDDLIAYLRAALPQMRGGHSTLLREAALADAYLKVVPAGRNGELVAVIHIDEIVGASPFPPMVLLPMAYAASEVGAPSVRVTAPCPGTTTATGTRSIEIRVTTAAALAGWEEPRLAPIRSVLEQYFGAAAALRIERVGGDMRAIITWPAAEMPTEPVAPATMAPV